MLLVSKDFQVTVHCESLRFGDCGVYFDTGLDKLIIDSKVLEEWINEYENLGEINKFEGVARFLSETVEYSLRQMIKNDPKSIFEIKSLWDWIDYMLIAEFESLEKPKKKPRNSRTSGKRSTASV